MRIKKGFELREVCGEHIIIGHGVENIDFTKIITLNESAADVWNAVVGKDSFSVEDMAKALTDNYEVDEDTAREDSQKLAESWKSAGLLDD